MRTILVLGESIAWGWQTTVGSQVPAKSPLAPATVLQTLLTYGEVASSPWAGAHVLDYSVPSGTSTQWVSGGFKAPMSTVYLGHGIPALDYAVAHNCSLLAAVDALLASGGVTPDLVLFLDGVADPLNGIPTATTIANLQTITAHFAAVPFRMSKTISYCIPPDTTPFPTWAQTLGDAMDAAGLTTGPRLPMQPLRVLSNGNTDWLHLTDAGYAVIAQTLRDTVLTLP